MSLFDPSGYSWFSKNWKSLVTAIVGIVVTVVTLGTGSSIGAFMIAGAVGGAAAGLTGALLNGANLGQTAKSIFGGAFWGAVGSFLSFASGGGQIIERLFKHCFSQAWLEGVRGGNMKHGLLAGATSTLGSAVVVDNWSKVGKIAANAIISGTATELGGGKFANGAITGAFHMMFNDLMHPKRVEINHEQKKIGQLPFNEKPAMSQHATYKIRMSGYADYYEDGKIIISLSIDAGNTMVSGDVTAQASVELILDGKVVKTSIPQQHYKEYVRESGYFPLGENNFVINDRKDYNQISVNLKGGWIVEISPGQRAVPSYPGTLYTVPLRFNIEHKIK